MLVRLLVLSLLFIGFLSCSSSGLNPKEPTVHNIVPIIDTASVAVISFDQNYDWPFKHTCKSTDLSFNDIQVLELLISRGIANYNLKLAPDMKLNFSIDTLKYNYKKQYVAVVNERGQKEVWVNGFCDTWGKEWKKELLMVHDGGNCYFNLKINMTTGECYEISVNGDA